MDPPLFTIPIRSAPEQCFGSEIEGRICPSRQNAGATTLNVRSDFFHRQPADRRVTAENVRHVANEADGADSRNQYRLLPLPLSSARIGLASLCAIAWSVRIIGDPWRLPSTPLKADERDVSVTFRRRQLRHCVTGGRANGEPTKPERDSA